MNTIFKFIKSLSAVEKTIAIIALPFILLQLIATIPLERGLAYLNDVGKSLDMKNIGEYIKWVTSDAIKEEMDTITNSGFTPKDISKELTNKAKNWFIEKFNTL